MSNLNTEIDTEMSYIYTNTLSNYEHLNNRTPLEYEKELMLLNHSDKLNKTVLVPHDLFNKLHHSK